MLLLLKLLFVSIDVLYFRMSRYQTHLLTSAKKKVRPDARHRPVRPVRPQYIFTYESRLDANPPTLASLTHFCLLIVSGTHFRVQMQSFTPPVSATSKIVGIASERNPRPTLHLDAIFLIT